MPPPLPTTKAGDSRTLLLSSPKGLSGLFMVIILVSIVITGSFTTDYAVLGRVSGFTSQISIAERVSAARRNAESNPTSWLDYLQNNSPDRHIFTQRIGCREMDAGAQSCVYEGFICINVSKEAKSTRPKVYFVNDYANDTETVYSDEWCQFRHQSSDPRYYASRHWPIRNGTFAPQRSCLAAEFRTKQSLLGGRLQRSDGVSIEEELPQSRIKWLESIWLVDLDYVSNSHNNHLLKEIIWMLDVVLWQGGVDLRRRPDDPDEGIYNDTPGHLFSEGPRHVYLPQGEKDFITQTNKDVNRLTYSLVLQRDLTRLYPNVTAEELHTPSTTRRTTSLLEAFPDLKEDERLLFDRDIREDDNVDLVCSPRFTAGSKIGNGAHERVCRYMRQRSYELFGVKEPEMKRVGQAYYPQPPKRIIILQRHITRKIANVKELEEKLRETFEAPHGVEVEVVTTQALATAEDHVRIFARAGVVITPHGSHCMGQIWMPRHSALIEIMPVGYTDYAFNLLAESCKIWYYELQSMIHPNKTEEYYEKECGSKKPHRVDPCTQVKSVDVVVNLDRAVWTIRNALEKIGYPIEPWLQYVQEGGW